MKYRVEILTFLLDHTASYSKEQQTSCRLQVTTSLIQTGLPNWRPNVLGFRFNDPVRTAQLTPRIFYKLKSKGLPRQAQVAQGVPGRLRPRISWRFGTTRVVDRQPKAPAAFTPGEIPGTHFQKLSRPQGTWFCRGYHGKKIPSDTTGNRSRDRPTSNAVP